MHIVCPHCTTSYAIDPATLGMAGRTVRCSRCKEVWLARPEDAIEIAPVAAIAAAGQEAGNADDTAAQWEAMAREEGEASDTPVIDSPSISGDWPVNGAGAAQSTDTDWPSVAGDGLDKERTARRQSWLRKLLPRPRTGAPRKPLVSLPTYCAAMGALVLALVIWGETRKAVELPRLRFSVRDTQGAEIYAWNTVLEQPVLKPGERAWFKSRLASPPPEGRHIDIRFFNKRDLAAR